MTSIKVNQNMDYCDTSVDFGFPALRLLPCLILYQPQHLSVVNDDFIEPEKKKRKCVSRRALGEMRKTTSQVLVMTLSAWFVYWFVLAGEIRMTCEGVGGSRTKSISVVVMSLSRTTLCRIGISQLHSFSCV